MNLLFKGLLLTSIGAAAYLIVSCPCAGFLTCSKNKIGYFLAGPGLILLLIPGIPPL